MQAERYGERELVRFEEQAWSFDDALKIAARRAAVLYESGIRAGDRVALMLSNRPEFLDLFFGCAWLGAIVVPINVASRGVQLQHILSNSGARLLVIEDTLAETLATIDLEVLSIDAIWVAGNPNLVCYPNAQALPRLTDAMQPPTSLNPSDLAAIIYTSGTTGPSKGV
jgi:crotonobetaine/carnitine-CoA ligase